MATTATPRTRKPATTKESHKMPATKARTSTPAKKKAASSKRPTRRTAGSPEVPKHHPLSYLIPPMSYFDTYVSRDLGTLSDLEYLDQVWAGDGSYAYNLLIEGPTGGAKTSLIYAWCAYNKVPLLPISGFKGIDMEVLIGGPGIGPDGSIRSFIPGVLVEAMQYGPVVVLLDEKNYIPQKAMGRLNSLLDRRKSLEIKEAKGSGWCATCGLYNDPARIEREHSAMVLAWTGRSEATAEPPLCEHCGEVYQNQLVVAQPGKLMVVATQNPGYEGVYEDNEAQRNRFDEVQQFAYDDGVEGELLWSSELMAFAKKVRSRYGTDFRTPLGTNRLMHFEQVALNGKLGLGMACEGLLAYFQPDERPAVQSLLELHLTKIESELKEV